MPQDVPFTVITPELMVTQEPLTETPLTLIVPFTELPVIVTLPELVAKMLDDDCIQTPDEPEVEAQEVPLTVIEPELVVTLAPSINTPLAPEVPLVAMPVIITLPTLVAVILADPSR